MAAAKKKVASFDAKAWAELEATKARADGLAQELASLQSRIKHDYVDIAEYRRVQALLRTTQQFARKYKNEARPDSRRVSDRRVGDETAAQRTIRERREAMAH